MVVWCNSPAFNPAIWVRLAMTVSFISLKAHSDIDFWDASSPHLQQQLNSSRTLFRCEFVIDLQTGPCHFRSVADSNLSFRMGSSGISICTELPSLVGNVDATLGLIVTVTEEQLCVLYYTRSSTMTFLILSLQYQYISCRPPKNRYHAKQKCGPHISVCNKWIWIHPLNLIICRRERGRLTNSACNKWVYA